MDGAFPEGTVFSAVARRLDLFHHAMGDFLRGGVR
jgi:hypothetical protein